MTETDSRDTEVKSDAKGLNFRSRNDDTLVFKRSHLYSVLLPLAFVLGMSVGYLFWGRDSEPPSVTPQVAVQPTDAPVQAAATQQIKRYEVPEDDNPSIGPEDAPITIIEFSDYECPYCRKWHDQVFKRIREDYPDEVRIVYRDFPLSSIHPNAFPAAEAANCARGQGAFWEFHDKLFSDTGLGEDLYIQYADDIGLDVEEFETCLEDGLYTDEVQGDFEYAATLGVRSTPTFFLNGIPIVGAQSFEVFKEVIDKELAGELP